MSRLAKNATDADREVAAAVDAAAAAAAAAAAKNFTLRLSVQVEAMPDDDEAPGEPPVAVTLHTVAASTTYGCSLYYIRLQPLLHTVAASTTRLQANRRSPSRRSSSTSAGGGP